ncbi:MAG: hypothetical protein H7Y09_12240 [Chitinophagaceae bacterium]|nr:hypothetical protein [Anaerolineae bacterium]
MSSTPKPSFSVYREKSLHAALKIWYAQPEDQFEVLLEGSFIDIVHDDLLIEIQTRNFTAIRPKLEKLLINHSVRLVHPISVERWIVKTEDSRQISRRKSPKRGSVLHIFAELVRIPRLIEHPNFSVEVLLIRDEEIQQNDGQGSWRRKGWSIVDRRLLEVKERILFSSAADFCALLPESLPEEFTTQELAHLLRQPRALVQKMTYCLRQMGVLEIATKRGNSFVYVRSFKN